MLSLKSIQNIKIETLKEEYFDLAIFASGYESRASYLARTLDLSKSKRIIVLGFAEYNDVPVRLENDEFYKSNGVEILLVSTINEKVIYDKLIEVFREFKL